MPHLVAIVDDDESVRTALTRLLRSAGYAATSFVGGAEFLLRPGSPHCLLLDLNMPGTNGADVLGRLVTLGLRIPTIIITGNVQESHAESVRALPVLRKPFDDQVLLDALAAAIHVAA